ncbi:MAG: HD domain-containing protein [Myxococcota bacterium]
MELTERLHCPGTAPLVALLMGEELRRTGRRLRRLLGWIRPPHLPTGRFAVPDSRLAVQATELARELSSPHLLHHCQRTWAFGVALAAQHGRRYDAELLYVASLLHDLGLTEAHRGPAPFELRGARAARAWCCEHGMPTERADRVHEAIALHTSLGITDREPESLYVHLGAGVDVFGLRFEEISRPTVDVILEQWPRLSFKESIIEDVQPEIENPGSPLTGMWRLGFARQIRGAPFAE